MANLPSLTRRTVIIGGGVHAQIFAATMAALGQEPPVVLEKMNRLGGVFGYGVRPFWLNSVNAASFASTDPGPTRIRSRSASDDLNWFPNCDVQVRGECMTEYPSSALVGSVVRRNVRKYAEVFTSCDVIVTSTGFSSGDRPIIEVDGQDYECGRLIDARGLTMTAPAGCAPNTSVITAMDYLAGRLPALPADPVIAVIGDGDTAYVTIEDALGQGPEPRNINPSEIGWYGPSIYPTKKQFMLNVHARYLGLARHMPQANTIGMIRPFLERGTAYGIGAGARVNGRTYDLAIYCTGFGPAFTGRDAISVGSLDIGDNGAGLWRQSGNRRYFVIGAAAGAGISYRGAEFGRGYTNFPRNVASIFRLGPETARLAASLPALT